MIHIIILLIPYIIIIYLMLRYKQYNNIVENNNYKPNVTIFLPTYNEENYIAKKLDNLLSQTYPIEILIYDCSTDKTRDIIKDYQSKHHNITLIEQKERIGMALTMNDAIDNSNCDIFIKTDVDSITLSNDAIKNIIKHFADPKIGVVTGTRVNKGLEDKYNELLTRLQIVESNIDSIVIGHSSSLLAFRKSAMEKISRYSMAEDTEEVIVIRRKGYKAIIDTSILSIEDIPQDFKTRRLQKDRRAEGIVRVLLKNKDMLFNKRYGKYGLIVLPMEFFLLVISPFLIFIIIIVILYTAYSINVYAGLINTLAFICMFLFKRIRVIIDTQISGMVATIKALLKKDNPLWEKVR